ncbi:hypothetical protein AB4Y89_19555 [Terriglobus sp. 2YAB30_2]|uniref:hypothetical protein n=1 Tax=Terriglobus sp. 2YAB30_2 TaxID=3233023 RepID=UPI003F95CB70
MDRRSSLRNSTLAGAASALKFEGAYGRQNSQALLTANARSMRYLDAQFDISDDGWRLWLDRSATWKNDTIYLPDDVKLGSLPVNAPTGVGASPASWMGSWYFIREHPLYDGMPADHGECACLADNEENRITVVVSSCSLVQVSL